MLAFVIGDVAHTGVVSGKDVGLPLADKRGRPRDAVKDNLILGEYEREGIRLERLSGVVVDAVAAWAVCGLLGTRKAARVLSLLRLRWPRLLVGAAQRRS